MLERYSYIVRFYPYGDNTEEFYYNTEEEAREHFELFRDDDSGLYGYIDLVKLDWYMRCETELDCISFEEE